MKSCDNLPAVDETAISILSIGIIFLVGLIADVLGRRTGIPRVTLLLVFGIAIGPVGVDLIPTVTHATVELVSIITLSFVAFLLGGNFRLEALRSIGADVLVVSFAIASSTAIVVFVAVYTISMSVPLAMILAAIAIATDPIAIHDVLGNGNGGDSFTARIQGIVVIDDAWALIAFSLVLATGGMSGFGFGSDVIMYLVREIGGAIALGTILGLPMAMLTGRIEPGEPTLVEAAGFVMLCAGLAIYLDVSMLLASMTMGVVTTNLAHHHSRPFQAVAGIEWPLLVAFFILTGATLRLGELRHVILLTAIYSVFRVFGRVVGGWLGATARRRPPAEGQWTGLALLPQAGVALGVALVGAQKYPQVSDVLLPAMVGATILFELIGPATTRFAAEKVGRGETDSL